MANPIPELPVSAFKSMGALTFVGINGQPRGLWDTGKKNFAPRIGLAFQLTPKTVIRGGYGIFYAAVGVDQNAVVQSGFSQTTNLTPSQDQGLTFRATLANPFPDGVLMPSPVGPATYLGRPITFFAGLRADGQNYWNAALYKQVAFRERYKMQVRTEWEGALNHAQFSPPNAAPTNSLFGQVSGTQGEARRIFVGLKLMF